MIRVLKLSIPFVACVLISTVVYAFVPFTLTPNAQRDWEPKITNSSPFAGMTVKQFLALTPKRYKQLTGERLTIPQRLTLKYAQYRIKKLLKKHRDTNLVLSAEDIDTNNFDILGFVLGIALGPLGILIAYLIEGKSSSTFRWAIIGALIWLGVFLLVVLVL